MVFSLFLVTNPRKALRTLFFRKSIILVTIALLFFLFLSSLGDANVRSTITSLSIQQTTDSDGDGLNDDLEDTLGTDKMNKSGDKDKDGLYDFEEYLDHYGTPDDTTDTSNIITMTQRAMEMF